MSSIRSICGIKGKKINHMNRKEVTEFLSELLVQQRLNQRGKYWASEVSLDYGTVNVKRVDFMLFEPKGVVHISEIEKGIFTSFEVKSCKADFNSGFGRNFETEKNYFVMPMSVYKEVVSQLDSYVGVICPIPKGKENYEEFENPTSLDVEDIQWEMKIIKPCIASARKRSMVELLFCLLRSGH